MFGLTTMQKRSWILGASSLVLLAVLISVSASAEHHCAAQDAEGVGACQLFFGVAWDGQQCVGISGCSCEGSDCDHLYETAEACTKAHAGCRCEPQDAEGEGACEMILGVKWDGKQCVSFSGCKCVGSDCDAVLHQSGGACEKAHEGCAMEERSESAE